MLLFVADFIRDRRIADDRLLGAGRREHGRAQEALVERRGRARPR